jgi:hypothetical protein
VRFLERTRQLGNPPFALLEISLKRCFPFGAFLDLHLDARLAAILPNKQSSMNHLLTDMNKTLLLWNHHAPQERNAKLMK